MAESRKHLYLLHVYLIDKVRRKSLGRMGRRLTNIYCQDSADVKICATSCGINYPKLKHNRNETWCRRNSNNRSKMFGNSVQVNSINICFIYTRIHMYTWIYVCIYKYIVRTCLMQMAIFKYLGKPVTKHFWSITDSLHSGLDLRKMSAKKT